jgi:hypothetical protein
MKVRCRLAILRLPNCCGAANPLWAITGKQRKLKKGRRPAAEVIGDGFARRRGREPFGLSTALVLGVLQPPAGDRYLGLGAPPGGMPCLLLSRLLLR